MQFKAPGKNYIANIFNQLGIVSIPLSLNLNFLNLILIYNKINLSPYLSGE